MSDDLVINVRQIAQYPAKPFSAPSDALLVQENGVGGAYRSTQAAQLVSSALAAGGWLLLQTGFGIDWNDRGSFSFDGTAFQFSNLLNVPELNATAGGLFDNGQRVATFAHFEWLAANSVLSVNNRTGHVQIELADIQRAGGATVDSPHFTGNVTAPTVWDTRQANDTVATTAWVQNTLCAWINSAAQTSLVTSFNGRHGDVILSADDVSAALLGATAPNYGRAPTPPFGDVSQRIATTAFVDGAVEDLRQWVADHVQAQQPDLSAYAPLASPQFSGTPTAPTPPAGASDGRLATTAFVAHAIVASTTGVASWNGRTGAVVLTTADITAAGGAPLAAPAFTGIPTAATASPGTSTTQLATTAFVSAALAAEATSEVSSFNGRTGAITLTTADVTGAGAAPLNNAALTGAPTAPTPAGADNSTRLATTAFVQALVSASAAGVVSFNGRNGVVTLIANDVSGVGGALLAGPAFSGVPTAPTAAPGTSSTQLATCAFVAAALAAGNVTSFNGRTGAIVLSLADLTGAGGAPISSPAFTGTPTAPTPSTTVNDGTLATTAFVHNLVTTAAGVASFNSRTGAVVLTAADVTAAGGALLASPAFTGIPVAATAAPGTNTTQLATTAFVAAAVNASVVTFNGRSGAVTFSAADLSAVGGAPLASPALTGTPTAPTATTGTSTTQIATTAFVQAAITAGGGVLTFNGRAGTVTLQASDVTGVGGALLASPTFTGTPAAPTPATADNSTALATTAYVTAKVNAAVLSFNGRTGTVTLSAADVTGVGGALLASPAFTGAPTAPTPTAGTSNTTLATTAFVSAAIAAAPYAPLASPAFSGTPTAPTAAVNNSTTQLATTAFVLGQAAIAAPLMDGAAAVGTSFTYARADHVHPTDTSRAPLASPAFTGTPTAPTAAAHTNNTQMATTAYVDAAVAAVPAGGATFAYWGGTVNLTNFGTNVSSTVPASGTATFATPHGLSTGQLVILTGTTPGILNANQAYYVRAISTATLAFYAVQADAKADANRIIWSGAGLAWSFRAVTYSGAISKNFDPVAPIGGVNGIGGLQFELNLSVPLPQTVNAMVFLERISNLFDNGATPTARVNWINQGTSPVIVNSTLLRLDRLGLTAILTGALTSPGSWQNQGTTSFYIGLSIIA